MFTIYVINQSRRHGPVARRLTRISGDEKIPRSNRGVGTFLLRLVSQLSEVQANFFLVRWTKATCRQSNLAEQQTTCWHECPEPRHKLARGGIVLCGMMYCLWIFIQLC